MEERRLVIALQQFSHGNNVCVAAKDRSGCHVTHL